MSANKGKVNVMSPIGLLCSMIENQLLTVDGAFIVIGRMKSGRLRLPWPDAEKVLKVLRRQKPLLARQALTCGLGGLSRHCLQVTFKRSLRVRHSALEIVERRVDVVVSIHAHP